MNSNEPSSTIGNLWYINRPVGRLGLVVLTLAICTAPAILFFDPADIWPGRGHLAREARAIYRLWSDDVAYVGGSRTWQRTVSNLFVPHNTHIVPAWRILTFALVSASGTLGRLPDVLAIASFSILVTVMLMTGRLVARETGHTMVGLASMALVGTTSLMLTPALWYSAGQPLWAGLGILATLWYAQSYRRSGRWPALLLACCTAPIAGWFWTVGHLAGPAAAVYLWVDGRRRCRRAALVPLVATTLAVGLTLALGARRLEGRHLNLEGRTIQQAVSPIQGVVKTLQAIPRNLILGDLGLTAPISPTQGATLMIVLFVLWIDTRRRATIGDDPTRRSLWSRFPTLAFNPLEGSGATVLIGSYLIEWSFRGYNDLDFWRTTDLRAMVPWYDAIPQIGAVLFLAGWWSGPRGLGAYSSPGARAIALTRLEGLGLVMLLVTLIVINKPRVDDLLTQSVPPLLRSETRRFAVLPRLRTIRTTAVLLHRATWQRSYLRRLDRAEELARRMGVGRDAIRAAFEHPLVPSSFGGQPFAEQLDLYDALTLLDVPEHGSAVHSVPFWNSMAELLSVEKEPQPEWLLANETWPPGESSSTKSPAASNAQIKR